MADQTQSAANDREPEGEMHRGHRGNPPDYDAFHVRDGNNDRSYWTRIGIAYKHKDDKGMNIDIDCIPKDGKIVLRERVDQLMEQRDKSQQTAPQQTQERSHGPER